MNINFKETESYGSQRTLVKILEKHPYFFVKVNEYDNYFFTCVMRCAVKDSTLDSILNFFRKKKQHKYIDVTMSLSECGDNGESLFEPIVFDRKEIDQIINDVPDTYIGEKTL